MKYKHIYYEDKRKIWRYLVRKRAVEALGGKCINCGIKFNNPSLFDFHHMKGTKEFTIGQVNITSPKKWLTIRDELKKCCLLCPNCHRGYHYGEINIEFKNQYFNEDYYDWEITDYKLCEITEDFKIQNKCKNIKRYNREEYICPICLGPKSFGSDLCHRCLIESKRKKIPSREDLINLIKDFPINKAAKKYNISDTAFRNWLEYRELPSHKKEIDAFFGRLKPKKIKKEVPTRVVEQYTMDNQYINTYDNCSAAGIALGNKQYNKHINECVNNKRKSAYGYKWKYKELPLRK